MKFQGLIRLKFIRLLFSEAEFENLPPSCQQFTNGCHNLEKLYEQRPLLPKCLVIMSYSQQSLPDEHVRRKWCEEKTGSMKHLLFPIQIVGRESATQKKGNLLQRCAPLFFSVSCSRYGFVIQITTVCTT